MGKLIRRPKNIYAEQSFKRSCEKNLKLQTNISIIQKITKSLNSVRLTKSWSFLSAKGHQIDPSHTYFHRTRLSYEEPQGGLEDGRNSGHRQAILQIKNMYCSIAYSII